MITSFRKITQLRYLGFISIKMWTIYTTSQTHENIINKKPQHNENDQSHLMGRWCSHIYINQQTTHYSLNGLQSSNRSINQTKLIQKSFIQVTYSLIYNTNLGPGHSNIEGNEKVDQVTCKKVHRLSRGEHKNFCRYKKPN